VGFEDVYRPRNPEENPLYGIFAGNLETFWPSSANMIEMFRYSWSANSVPS